MKSQAILLFGLFCLVAISEAMKSYEGYKVLSVVPSTEASAEFLQNLMMTDSQVDFWTEPRRLGQKVDIMVGPSYLLTVQNKLTEADVPHNISIDNVQELIIKEQERLETRNARGQNMFNIDDFNTLPNIISWLQALTMRCPAGVNCELYTIGKSYDGNPIYVFKMSKSGKGRKAFWVDATIHAREWITTATILKIINQLVTQSDENAIKLINKYDWYFLPVLNPDGYLYTWSKDRLWRKNRSPNKGSTCVGTDLNRNFNFRWAKEVVSHNPCSQMYCGPSAGSEPETKVTSAELNRIGSTVVTLFTLHSYSNLLIFPWGNHIDFVGRICERAKDHDELMRVADAAANAIDSTYNTCWSRGNSCEVIYATTGDTADYAKGVVNIKYSYKAELRGKDFIIDAAEIPLSFQEIYNGIVAMVNAIKS